MTNSTHSAPARATPTCDDFEAYDMRRADWAGMEERMSEEDSAARRRHEAAERQQQWDRAMDVGYAGACLMLFAFAALGVVTVIRWLFGLV